jgi:hypothetical protein
MGILLALAVLSGTAAAGGTQGQSSWCSTPSPVPGVSAATDRHDVEFTLLARNQLMGALRRLARRAVIRLDARAFRRLARGGAEPARGRYLYLVRAGIMTPVDLPDRDFPEHAERSRYMAADYLPGRLNIVSLHASPTEQRPRNYAVLIASSTPVPDVLVACIGGR